MSPHIGDFHMLDLANQTIAFIDGWIIHTD